MSILVKENEEKQRKIAAFQELKPTQYALIDYKIEEIVEALPYICSDLGLIFSQIEDNIGKDCWLPVLSEKYPDYF